MNAAGAGHSAGEERFDRWRKQVGLVAGPLLMLLVWWLPISTLPEAAHRTLAVMAWVVTWWVTEALPLAATALLGPALCVLFGIAPAREALRPFADPVIFLFLGSFLLAEALMKHQVNRRIALSLLKWRRMASSPLGLYAAFGMITAFLSAWVSNTATAAMMLPIAVSLLKELAIQRGEADAWKGSDFAQGLILVTAFAASIGGLATPIGTPPNLIGLGLIEFSLDAQLTFFDWMRFALPIAAILTAFLVWHLSRLAKQRRGSTGTGEAWVTRQLAELGPWSRPQLQVAAVFAGAVFLWIAPGFIALFVVRDAPLMKWFQAHMPEGVVAILAAVCLFALPSGRGTGERTLAWSDAARIDWGTILLFGGGMALGELMFSTGLAKWLGEGLAGGLPTRSVLTLTILFALIGMLVSEATSNTASATMIIPLAIAVAEGAGVDPLKPALAACLGCSLGFMLPVSTPPNALAYGTGAVPLTRMIRHGFWLDMVGVVVVVLGVSLFAP